MSYYFESGLVETTDGMQFKVYATSHPEGFVIAKPKYIPLDIMEFTGLKKRYLFNKAVTRFNLFNSKEVVEENLKRMKAKFPDYIYTCDKHNNWFLGVPENKIKKQYDSRKGVKELLRVPYEDCDPYLKAVQDMIGLMEEAGIPQEDLGISHSTLLGNYTPGKSDIDILIFGIDNGWKAVRFMETCKHPKLAWKSEEGWAKYFKDRVVSKVYSEEEYVANMVRKRDDGLFDGNVFSLFCVEKPEELDYDWKAQREPCGTVKLKATIKDDYKSIVRPGYYEIENTEILDGHENVEVKRIVTWARPFVLQAKKGEEIEACGLLEKVTGKDGEFYQLVIGYFDTYTTERGELEYLKALIT